MNLFGARVSEHGDDTVNGCSANYTVVDHNHTLTAHHVRNRIELDANALHSLGLAGLDKGSADVAVLYDRLFIRNAALLRIADGRVDSGLRNADDHICFNGKLTRERPFARTRTSAEPPV